MEQITGCEARAPFVRLHSHRSKPVVTYFIVEKKNNNPYPSCSLKKQQR